MANIYLVLEFLCLPLNICLINKYSYPVLYTHNEKISIKENTITNKKKIIHFLILNIDQDIPNL